MSSELSVRASMDTIHPISQPRDAAGQIKTVSLEEKNVSVDVKSDISVSGNDVPAESRIAHEASKASLNKALDEIYKHSQAIKHDLEFSIDEQLNKTVVTVYDAETKEVIRKIPSEEILELARHLDNHNNSVLFRQKA